MRRDYYWCYPLLTHLFSFLNFTEIPELPAMGEGVESYQYQFDIVGNIIDEKNHPGTDIAMTASAIDGAIGDLEFLTDPAPVAPIVVSKHVPTGSLTSRLGLLPSDMLSIEKIPKKRPSPAKKTEKATKKRRVNKSKAVVSPGSSIAGDSSKESSVELDSTMPTLPSLGEELAKKESSSPKLSGWSDSADESSPEGCDLTGEANIETDYIKMLVSENGPAECAKAIVSNFATDGRTRTNRQHLTPAERSKASRDRNREHARNTRRRKKVYVDELKRTLIALSAQREAEKKEQEEQAQMLAQHRSIRYNVLQEFLNLRGGNVRKVDRWDLILVPEFSLRVPTITASLQDSNDFQVQEKTFNGVLESMGDADAMATFLQSMSSSSSASNIALVYNTDENDFCMDGASAVLEWNASTVGATQMGAQNELNFHGSLKATFDPKSNKIISIKMIFDTGAVLSQRKNLLA